MDKNELYFWFNKTEKILMQIQDSPDEIDCCYDASIYFMQPQENVLLLNDSLHSAMSCLSNLLKKALSNELLLDRSIRNDIGFMYNQYSHFLCMKNSAVQDTFVYDQLGSSRFWIGIKHHLWANEFFVSWIYNDQDSNIVFEVTPFYPYMYSGAEKKLGYSIYTEWIKNYKPYAIRVISKETAQRWLEQANSILAQIDKNIEQWKKLDSR